MKARTSTH